MRKNFSQKLKRTFASLCRVTSINSANISVSSELDIKNIKVLTIPGISALPKVGDSGVVLPLEDGSFILLGNIKSEVNTSSGELKFQADSGAYIALKENGDVEINSMLISPNGTIR